MSKITLQYVAGFFDGEGSIGIYYRQKTKDRFYLRTQLTNNKNKAAQKLMDYLIKNFGGNLSEQVTLSGKIKYNWQLNSDNAVYFLKKILPYLIFKKDQAIIAINWQEQRPPRIRDERGRICVKRKRTVDFDVKVSRLIKALKREDIDTVIANQKDLIEVITELYPLVAGKLKKKLEIDPQYKNIGSVDFVQDAGLSKKVAKLVPLAVIKGE